jgi:hypothetical protein
VVGVKEDFIAEKFSISITNRSHLWRFIRWRKDLLQTVRPDGADFSVRKFKCYNLDFCSFKITCEEIFQHRFNRSHLRRFIGWPEGLLQIVRPSGADFNERKFRRYYNLNF